MKAVRVVIDTNVFISLVLFGGEADKIRVAWKKDKIIFLISREILEEYIKVLSYPKFKLTGEEIKSVLEEELLPFVTTVQVKSKIALIEKDPDDDKFLSLAVDGRAEYIVSGDKYLLGVRNYRGIKIVTIREFLEVGIFQGN